MTALARARNERDHAGKNDGEGGDGEENPDSADPLTRFRAEVLRRSVPIFLGVVLALVTVAGLDGHRLDRVSAAFLVATMVGLALATAIPWHRVAASPESWASWAWCVLVSIVLGGLAFVPGLAVPTRPMFGAVVVMSGLVLTPIRHLFVTVLALALTAGSLYVMRGLSVSDVAGTLLIVGVASFAAGYAGRQLERTARSDRRHIRELVRERSAYRRLYGLATTLGASNSIDDTLPDLLDKLCTHLDSRFGAWLLVDEHRGTLSVVPPIVMNGLPTELPREFVVATDDSVFLTRALRAGRPLSIRVENHRKEREGLLGMLELKVAMASPLVVDGVRIGVLVVGDPTKGHYDDADLEELHALAGSAALVLAQLGRHREAADLASRLREIAEMKTDFVSVVSHELRTPLTSIRAALDTLARPGLIEEDTVASELVESARRQTGRLERLIEDLLVTSRVERGTLRSSLEHVDLARVVADVVADVASPLVRVDVDPGLEVFADPDQLAQIVRNLIENGLKYGDGSDVDVSAARERGGVTLVVADRGPGVAVEDRERIFERFVQLERPDRRSHQGSGLGLAIVASLVASMQGRVAVGDTPGGGATFRVSLRAVPVPATTLVGSRL